MSLEVSRLDHDFGDALGSLPRIPYALETALDELSFDVKPHVWFRDGCKVAGPIRIEVNSVVHKGLIAFAS